MKRWHLHDLDVKAYVTQDPPQNYPPAICFYSLSPPTVAMALNLPPRPIFPQVTVISPAPDVPFLSSHL